MLNKCEFIGRITKELELRRIKSKDKEGELISKVDFNIAINFKKNGNEEVMFVPCTAFTIQADNMLKYLHKGSKVYVEGYLNINHYTDERTNEKKTFTKINVKNVVFLDSKNDKTNEEKKDKKENTDIYIEGQELDILKEQMKKEYLKKIEDMAKINEKLKNDNLGLQRELRDYEKF